MAEYNRPALLAALAQFQHQLTQLTQTIEHEDWSGLQAYLTAANQDRPAFVDGR